MSRDLKPTDQYEMTYQGTRDAILSAFGIVVVSVVLFLIGVFGFGMLTAVVIALNNGTATQSAFFAGLTGVAAIAFAAYELYHLR
jgi:ABC-type antimicrobial peptide transport system permease subunit